MQPLESRYDVGVRLRNFLLSIGLAAPLGSSGHAAEPLDAVASSDCTQYSERVAGIDVSKYQGTVQWQIVQKAAVNFVFIRVSDGTDSPDERFAENWTQARAGGLLRGAYQYFRPSEDPVAQARIFLHAVRRLRPGDLPPVLDVETLDDLPAKNVVVQMQQWLTYVAKRTGRTPILYTNVSTWDALGSPDFSGYPLWLARWEAECPPPLAGFSRWHFWQHSSAGQVEGIEGAVDLDWYNGTLAELRLLSGIKPPSPRRAKSATGPRGHD